MKKAGALPWVVADSSLSGDKTTTNEKDAPIDWVIRDVIRAVEYVHSH